MPDSPHTVKLYFNRQASGSPRHQVDTHKVDLGKRGDTDAWLRIKNESACKVRVCFATDLFAGLSREPDPGTTSTYYFADIDAGKHLDLRTTTATATTATNGDGYQFRFIGAGCNFQHVGDHRGHGKDRANDPGDDPRVVIG